jgi:glycyl-tRNA synthetase beta chain
MTDLLLEIGTEELPAGYIEPALEAFVTNLLDKLKETRIDYGEARTMGTPRRLTVKVRNVSTRQRPITAEIIGPPKSVGFDDNCRPTVAGKKFAERVGAPVNALKIKETPKGSYLYIEKKEKGRATKFFLKTILPEVIHSIPFPKTMRWADLDIQFARPIHSIMALLGDDVVSFRFENIRSGRYTSGHPFMHSGRIRITKPSEYTEKLKRAFVIVNVDERKHAIENEIEIIAEKIGGAVLPDTELLEIVKNLVEYPAVVAGRYDKEFLDLPREILITTMREHQKYFAVVDDSGDLVPWFIAVNNTVAKDPVLVAKGHERVLRARLDDAHFFYKADHKTSIDEWLGRLKGVLFQAKLGSMYDKVMRIEKLVAFLGDLQRVDSDVKKHTSRAARLCKVDLVSQVVGEFPKLQGTMGRIYSAVSGEPEPVSIAIEEHYQPTYSGGPLPKTLTGAILSICDKLDSISGCFSAGLLPTGASDPYALRRQGIGVVQIMLDKDFSFSLRTVIEESLKLFRESRDQRIDGVADKVYAFLQNRIAQLMADEGFPKDIVSAVTSVSVDDVPAVWNRVRALASLKKAPEFEPLAIAFKRVVNILRQAKQTASGHIGWAVDESLFEDECEFLLLNKYQSVKKKVKNNLDMGNVDQALRDIASLRPSIDAFFDGVMVLSDDMKLRENRLALLGKIANMFEKFADFSKISN